MIINPDITEVLKEFKINKDEGLLCLLGFYYNLDVEKVCSNEVINAINLTKIVEKDYQKKTIKWNMPLFQGQQTAWDWVINEYNSLWNINTSRKDGSADVIKRMQEFFKKYPQYRKDDVLKASRLYMSSVKDKQYLKSSAKFIFEGSGALKSSILLGWCEKLSTPTSNNQAKGIVR